MKRTAPDGTFALPSDGQLEVILLQDRQGQLVSYLPGYGDYNDIYAGDDLDWLLGLGYQLLSPDDALLLDPVLAAVGGGGHLQR